MTTRNELIDAIARIGVIGAVEAGLLDAVTGEPFTPAADVADIADTTTADAEEVAEKVNELLTSLRAAGIIA